MNQFTVTPSLETAREVIAKSAGSKYPPNLLPLTASIPADLLTPTVAYLKIAAKCVLDRWSSLPRTILSD